MKRYGVVLIVMLTFYAIAVSPIANRSGVHIFSPDHHFTSSDSAYIDGLEYAWQEINGFCNLAAVTMALQSIGIEVDLHTLFAVSGIGFTTAYVKVNETLRLLAGSSMRQQAHYVTISELYNVDHSVFVDKNSPWAQQNLPAWIEWGVNASYVEGEGEAFQVLKATLNEGYPIVAWVDPYFLPPADYDLTRTYGQPMDPSNPVSGHAILIVGYNDTSGTVDILDPGVGSFGDTFGYPDDGRWAYTMEYTIFKTAWNALGYGMTIFKSVTGPSEDFTTDLGELIVERLSGNRTSNAPGSENVSYVNFGESAFREMSLDLTPDVLGTHLEQFADKESKLIELYLIGIVSEQSMTLQYLSYRTALATISRLLPDVNLTQFTQVASEALTHMEVLSNNNSLVEIFDPPDIDSLLIGTFMAIANNYDESNNMTTALAENVENLSEIAQHLLAIADSWKEASQALDTALSEHTTISTNPTISTELIDESSPLLLITMTGFASVVIVAVIVFYRKHSINAQ
ncbi:MAG: C39 family peptidase [Candidatus Thorarchaeota archaeon]